MTQKTPYLFEDIEFGLLEPPRLPQYSGYSKKSLYLEMRDGVKLALDVLLPQGLRKGVKIPTLVYRTRYWRETEYSEPKETRNPIFEFYLSHGFALIDVDVRGTGASFGKVIHEWQTEDTQDAYEIVDWIISQEWSNGKVGAFGFSYPGTTALLMLETNHPAVMAVRPSFFEFDAVQDIAMPGGIKTKFLYSWGEFTKALDNNIYLSSDDQQAEKVIGVKPVDDDRDRNLLQAAIYAHKSNNHAHTLNLDTDIDQPIEKSGRILKEMLVYPRQAKIEKLGRAIDIWGSWMDANTADTVLRVFTNFGNPQRAVIGAWNHGGTLYNSPFVPADSPLDISAEEQLNEALAFFDQTLGNDPGRFSENILYYLTMGEEKWKSTRIWPLPNTLVQRWYFQPGKGLSNHLPMSSDHEEIYKIEYSHTTGTNNRWWTEMEGSPVIYADRMGQDEKLLVYESQPLEQDLEITGYPIVNLMVRSTHEDGAFFVYLECVDPQGQVIYITEGMLRGVNRKVMQGVLPYKTCVPFHSLSINERQPIMPGEITPLHFGLFPTSVLIKKGWKIRVAIGGADADSFERIPANGFPTIVVQDNKKNPSFIEFPVIPR